MRLRHVTSSEALASIERDGVLRGPSYWAADEGISAYYAETVEDEGLAPVIVAVDLASLDAGLIRPDMPSIEEPIMTVLRARHGWDGCCGEERVWEEWAATARTWQDCLALVGSVRYMGDIPAHAIEREDAPGLRS